jgi:hypothetical protein
MKFGTFSSLSERGATLIELLIAVIILLVAIVPVAQMVSTGLHSDLNNRSNSVGLVAAEREMEQMMLQTMTVAGGGACSAVSGSYYFCDTDGQTVGMGQTGAGATPTQIGCPLDSAKVQLDFNQGIASCASGYSLIKQLQWNQLNGTTISVELRWRVVSLMSGGTPFRKFMIIGARAQQPGGGTLITNLQTVVGPH